MTIRPKYLAVLTPVMASIAMATSIDTHAQTPPPKKEAELIAAGYKRRSGQEITTHLVGNTSYILFLTAVSGAKPGSQMTIFYRDARTRFTVLNFGPSDGKKTESNWWIEGDFLCTEQRLANVGHVCSSHYDVGSSSYICIQPAGDCIYLSRTVPGNPEKI